MRISDWSSDVCSSDLSEDLGSGSLLGDLAAVVTALCIGGTFVIARHGRAVSMVPAMALAGLLTAAVALPAALLLEDGPLLYSGARLGYALIMGLLVVPGSFALKIGRAHVGTPVPNEQLVCSLLI